MANFKDNTYIVYNREVKKDEGLTQTIPHSILNNNIRTFLIRHKLTQNDYIYDQNEFYFFIYPNAGGKITYQL